MRTPPGLLMGVMEHRGLCGRSQSPGAHQGGESLVETPRFLLSGPVALCKAILQRMDLLLAC